jgi:glycosyltransferase involved in cell wall biosynthesis
MRILIATLHRQLEGGVETYLHALLPGLCERGHEVALLHEHPAPVAWPTLDDRVPGIPVWWAGESGWAEQVAAWQPDVVYLQGLESPDRETMLAQAYSTVLFAHNYHGTCISGTKRFAWPSVEPCERVLGVGCLVRYLPWRCGGLHPSTMLEKYAVQKRRRALLPSYRAVLVASRHMEAEYRRHGVPADRLHWTPLFPADICPDAMPPSERDQTGRVLLVGRLTPLKGCRLLIEAVGRSSTQLGRPLELVVAGDGPERAEMEKLAASANVPTRCVGWVESARRTELMRDADVLAVPSLWPEPFGLVGIEAGCVGLPAAGFAIGGIPDWLEPDVTGESTSVLTADGLADALTRTMRDPAHWQRLRHGAWEMSQRFSADTHLQRLEAVLQSCVREAAPC